MIIIINSYFPYSGGETFLAREIEVLSKYDQVILFPINVKRSVDVFEHSLPSNVSCFVVNDKNSFGNKLLSTLGALFSQQSWSDVLSIIRNGFTIKRIVAAFYYSCLSLSRYYIISKKIRTLGKEEFIIYSYWMHLPACIAVKLKKRFPKSIFITRAHGYDLYEERASSHFLPGRKQIFENADKILPVSEASVSYLKSKYSFIDNNKLICSHLGTKDHGLNPSAVKTIRIVSCSNLVPVKRVDMIISALSLIDDVDIEWIHYGAGTLLEELKQKASIILAKTPNIKWSFYGSISNASLMDEYNKTHITFFINTSESEGLPVSIMEAMSFGIPVIATNVGGTGEIVQNEKNGLLLDKEIKPSELASIIRNAIKMPTGKYASMRIEARTTWENNYDSEKNYGEFYSLISQITRY